MGVIHIAESPLLAWSGTSRMTAFFQCLKCGPSNLTTSPCNRLIISLFPVLLGGSTNGHTSQLIRHQNEI